MITTIIMILGIVLGIILGVLLPTIPYTASKFLAIAIVAAVESVLGWLASRINKKFNVGVFVSCFFINAILAIVLTYFGERLNVDIYLATIIVFVGRIFNNLGIIRRYYLNILAEKAAKRKDGKIPEKVDVPDNDAEKEVQE